MARQLCLFVALLSLVGFSCAAPPPSGWYQPRENPYAHLFQRQSPVPPVGSDAWVALYPQESGTPTSVPQSWTDALNNAVAAGLIPNISVSTLDTTTDLTSYPDGSPTDPDICSFTYQCNATDDIIEPPAGILALSFDDGPLAGSSDLLYAFLKENDQHATHFMIGVNILGNPQQFLEAFQTNEDHIAVHTWSHPYLTTKTNDELVAELGWCAQIIHDSTGGLVPSSYRPPYGDTDMRVRAIAQHVFGLKTVTWDQDSSDWAIGTSTTLPAVEASLYGWVTGGKVPGLMILEHELFNDTVNAFMNAYPTMKSAGWDIMPVPNAFNFSWYQNAVNSSVEPAFSLGIASPVPTGIPLTTSVAVPTPSLPVNNATVPGASGTNRASSPSGSASKSGALPGARVVYPALLLSSLFASFFISS